MRLPEQRLEPIEKDNEYCELCGDLSFEGPTHDKCEFIDETERFIEWVGARLGPLWGKEIKDYQEALDKFRGE